MALINCPECGKEISDKSKACIHCGYPLGEETDNSVVYIKCLECGQDVPNDVGECPYCGCPVEDETHVSKFENQKNKTKSRKKTKIVLLVIAGIIVFLALLFAIKELTKCEHKFDFGKVTKESTCTEEGEKTFTCELCGEEKTESISFAEHTYDSGKITKEATCTEEGEKILTCKVCGNEKIEPIRIKDHDYEEKITKEATFKEEGIKTFTCKICGDTYTESIPIRDDKIVLTVEDKINYEKDTNAWRFNPFVELVCKIENMTDKEIKGIEGELIVNDLFGKQIIVIDWDVTGENIPAHGFITKKDYGLEINEFRDADMKLYNMDYDDLKFEYKVKQIIYTDGTNESL